MKTVYSLLCGFIFISLLASCGEANIEKTPAPAITPTEVEKASAVAAKTNQVTEEQTAEKAAEVVTQTNQITEEQTAEKAAEVVTQTKQAAAEQAVEKHQVEKPAAVVEQAQHVDDSNAKFKEGTHYQVVKQTATATPEVMEFFSFYCPHCFKFEPLIATLKANLADDVKIKKNHVNFIGKEMGPLLTRAFAAAEILEVEEKVTNIIFDQIHTQKKAINGEKDILTLFEKAGVSQKEAESALRSFPVSGLASQMKHDTETYHISGVPTIIVNGKYKVNTGSVKSEKEFIDLVAFLTKKKD